MRLSQRELYHRTSPSGVSYFAVMSLIASLLGVTVPNYLRERAGIKPESGLLVTVKSLEYRLALIAYLTSNPLLSIKRLDYAAWLEAHNLLLGGRSAERDQKVKELKSSMNSKRTDFD